MLKFKESPSVTEYLEVEYVIICGVLLLLSLALIKSHLVIVPYWKVLITGIFVAFISSSIALPLAQIAGLADGLERLGHGYSLVGVSGLLMSFGLYATTSGAWFAGILSYWLVWRYCLYSPET